MNENKIKISKDIDLINNAALKKIITITIEEMNDYNYLELVACDVEDYVSALKNYECNICHTKTSIDNPIYTNHTYLGADICKSCINRAVRCIKPQEHSTYSLKNLCDFIKYIDDID